MGVTTLRKPKWAIALFDVLRYGKRIFAGAIAELKTHRCLLRENGAPRGGSELRNYARITLCFIGTIHVGA
jgi:hypothetical protein